MKVAAGAPGSPDEGTVGAGHFAGPGPLSVVAWWADTQSGGEAAQKQGLRWARKMLKRLQANLACGSHKFHPWHFQVWCWWP